jgi:hypothetical protein
MNLDSVRAAVIYTGKAKPLLWKLKYNGAQALKLAGAERVSALTFAQA